MRERPAPLHEAQEDPQRNIDGEREGADLRNRRHVIKIAEELQPDPSQFTFSDFREEPGACACGQKIQKQFILKGPGEKEVVIGSTCIEETVPFLISMGARELAESLRGEWKRVLFEMRKDKSYREGLEKLRSELPAAAGLEAWFRTSTKGMKPYQYPPYFQRIRSLTEPALDLEQTPARRASMIRSRVQNFRERLPLLRVSMNGARIPWKEPSPAPEASDRWLDLWMRVEEEREALRDTLLFRHADLALVDTDLLKKLREACDEYPVEETDMEVFIEYAEGLMRAMPSRRGVSAVIEGKKYTKTKKEDEAGKVLESIVKKLDLRKRRDFLARRLQDMQQDLLAAPEKGAAVRLHLQPYIRGQKKEYQAKVGSTVYILRKDDEPLWKDGEDFYQVDRELLSWPWKKVVLIRRVRKFAEDIRKDMERYQNEMREIDQMTSSVPGRERAD